MLTPRTEFWSKRRVLLTGHTGFKGAWLSLWLKALGAEVLGVSLPPQKDPNLFTLAELQSRMSSCFGDIRDFAFVQKQFAEFQPDLVIHMAAQALVRPSYLNPIETYSTNVMGTVHVLEAARHTSSVRAVVNVTSDKCYENRAWSWGYRENEAMGGHDPYSNSKGCAELVTSCFQKSYFSERGLGLASARAGNVIGGGDWSVDRLIPDCIRAFGVEQKVQIRHPSAIRPWQHVLEPLGGYLSLAQQVFERPQKFSSGWNFGPASSEAKNVSHIVTKVAESWGQGAAWQDTSGVEQINAAEATVLKLDCSKAEAELGWRARLTTDEAVNWTVSWYKDLRAGANARELCLHQLSQYQEKSC